MEERTCGECGTTYPASQAGCPRCGVEFTADALPELELDWGDRRRAAPPPGEEEAVAPVEQLPPEPQWREPPPVSAPVPGVDLDAGFEGFVRVADLVLLGALIFELASGGLSLIGAVVRSLGAATADTYLPSKSRLVELVAAISMSVMWTGLVLRLLRPRHDLSRQVALMWLLPFLPAGRAGWAELAADMDPPPRRLPLIPAAMLLACGGWLTWGLAITVFALKISLPGLLLECALALAAAFAFARMRSFLRRFHAERSLGGDAQAEEPALVTNPPVAPPVAAAVVAPVVAAAVPPPVVVPAVAAVPVPVPVVPAVPVLCLACGATISLSDATCAFCKTRQLFDVVGSTVANEKVRYALARQVAALGVPGLEFKDALERLRQPRPLLAQGIARGAALRLVDTLVAQHSAAKLVPSKGRRAEAGLVGLQVAVAVAVLGWVGFTFTRRPKETEDLAALAKKSTVTVLCDESLGTGFVIAKDTVVTNEHVACAKGAKMTVLFPDGRKYDATLRVFDDWLDLAVLDVPGAGDVALKLGDATTLREGSRVVMVGAPKGLSFSVHQAIISHVGRTQLGLTYLQFDGNVNPGNSGGPLLDAEGNVVGIVSMRLEDSEGLGFALPINYLREPRLVPPELVAPVSPAWKVLLDAAHADELKDLEAVHASEQRTEVVRLVRATVVVSARSERPPPRRNYELNLEVEGRRACAASVSSSEWKPVEFNQPRMPQRIRWLQKNGLLSNFYVASVPLFSECTAAASSGSEIVLVDGVTELLRVPFD